VYNPTCLLQKEGIQSIGLSHEEAQNKDGWRLRIKGQPTHTGKMEK